MTVLRGMDGKPLLIRLCTDGRIHLNAHNSHGPARRRRNSPLRRARRSSNRTGSATKSSIAVFSPSTFSCQLPRAVISRNHLAKVAQDLAAAGFVQTQRGRNGGVRLARSPAQINVGEVVRSLENTTEFDACMGGKEKCRIDGACGLKPALAGALEAFLAYLDQFDLAQITGDRSELLGRLTPAPN